MLYKYPVGSRWAWFLLFAVVVAVCRDIITFPRDPNTLEFTTFAGHEWVYNQYRIIGMAQALVEGMPGRWLESYSHGWGYPLFHYTGPLPYSLGAGLHLFGLDSHAALNMSWLLAFLLSGFTMFWAMRRIFGDWGALLASTIYLFAPYHLVDMYVRTNLVETMAFVFPPLILYGLWKIRENPVRGIVVGAIGVTLLPLTHLLSSYLIGLGLMVFCICYLLIIPLREKLPFLLHASAMASVGLGLSAFFWMPAAADLSVVKGMKAITAGSYDYNFHFVYPSQLFSSFWGYGASGKGIEKDFMSLSLGISSVIFAMLSLALALFILAKKWRQMGVQVLADGTDNMHRIRFLIAVFAAGLFSAYMATYLSSPAWKIIPMVEATQFPWRFLFPASFFVAVLAAGLPALFGNVAGERRWLQVPVAILASLCVAYFHWSFAKAGSYHKMELEDLTRAKMLEDGVWTTNQHEFLPSKSLVPWASERAKRQIFFYEQDMSRSNRVLGSKWKSGLIRLKLMPGKAGTLVVQQHWHPGWRASIDGHTVETEPLTGHPFAPIALEVPENAVFIELRYGFTAAGKLGLLMSIVVLLAGAVYLIARCRFFELRRVWVGFVLLLATILFYWGTSVPKTTSLKQRLASIGKHVRAEAYAEIKQDKTSWDAKGNLIFKGSGLMVYFDTLVDDNQLQLSTDSNDYHLLVFLNGKEILGTKVLPPRHVPGISNHGLNVDEDVYKRGYDRLAILPISGDGYFSLAHIFTSNDAELKNQQIVERAKVGKQLQISHSELPKHVRAGKSWEAEGNIKFSSSGVEVQLDSPVRTPYIQVSLDHNDYHQILFYLGDELKGRLGVVPRSSLRGGGMRNYRFAVPALASAEGFDRIKIVPTLGDGYYSLGHLKLN